MPGRDYLSGDAPLILGLGLASMLGSIFIVRLGILLPVTMLSISAVAAIRKLPSNLNTFGMP